MPPLADFIVAAALCNLRRSTLAHTAARAPMTTVRVFAALLLLFVGDIADLFKTRRSLRRG